MSDRIVTRAPFVPDIAAIQKEAAEAATAVVMASMTTALAGKASNTALTMVAQTIPGLADAAPVAIVQDSAPGTGMKAARSDHTHELRFKRVKSVTNAAGQVAVTWAQPFGAVPVLNKPVVVDPLGGVYSETCLTNTAAGCSFQIKKARTLPAVIALLGTLAGYDPWIAAPAGLTVYISGAEAAQ